MIKGGYILFARKTIESKIMKAPPLTFKLWGWILLKATFKSNWKYQSGKFETTIKEMQKAMTHYVGNRKEKPSIARIRTAYMFLAKLSMISTAKRTGGLVITICNYDKYQDPKNYETHAETHAETHSQKIDQKVPQCSVSENTSEPHNKDITEQLPQKDIEANQQSRNTDPIAHPYNNKNVLQQNNIEYYINIYNKNYPCQNDEEEFERDRRIFFNSFQGIKTFQTFDDNSDRKDKKLAKIIQLKKDHMPAKLDISLEKGNDMGAGIYLCINETNGNGRLATDVVKVRSVFADFDGSPLEPVWEYEPSMVVESSQGKYHAYWFTSDTPLESFRIMQESISNKFDSDPKVKDLPRVMRIPGFNHMKADPFMSKIIHYSGQDFSFGYLVELFPPIPVKKWSAPKYNKPLNGDSKEFKGQRGVSQGDRNCHIIKCLGGAKKRGLSWDRIEQEAYLEGAACVPPLKQSEIKDILKSFRRY